MTTIARRSAVNRERRFTGVAMLIAVGAISGTAALGIAPAGAEPQQPVKPTLSEHGVAIPPQGFERQAPMKSNADTANSVVQALKPS
ncbi:hypothetical protein [Mycolicibacterium gadium]|uniref:Uncharacterized protein n=1 Tax=Mycolicibacterium gadium TaxID=1794 RepID=A0A7I7WHK8_MYCGU|nr:hypothetical protein [Mycolicibacterium gadium]BBZ16215.1 hypothetical protein MGAD_05500 [Mycolicibacterium gadium]